MRSCCHCHACSAHLTMPLAADLVAVLTKATQAQKEAQKRHLYQTKLTEEARRLETLIRDLNDQGNHDRIAKIVHQLCHDYAYAVHQPHARNGGLIGLAAAAIALGAVRVRIRSSERGTTLTVTASSALPQGDRPTRPRLLLRPRCSRALLRL